MTGLAGPSRSQAGVRCLVPSCSETVRPRRGWSPIRRRVRAAAQRRAPDPYYGNLNHTVHNQARAKGPGPKITWPGKPPAVGPVVTITGPGPE